MEREIERAAGRMNALLLRGGERREGTLFGSSSGEFTHHYQDDYLETGKHVGTCPPRDEGDVNSIIIGDKEEEGHCCYYYSYHDEDHMDHNNSNICCHCSNCITEAEAAASTMEEISHSAARRRRAEAAEKARLEIEREALFDHIYQKKRELEMLERIARTTRDPATRGRMIREMKQIHDDLLPSSSVPQLLLHVPPMPTKQTTPRRLRSPRSPHSSQGSRSAAAAAAVSEKAFYFSPSLSSSLPNRHTNTKNNVVSEGYPTSISSQASPLRSIRRGFSRRADPSRTLTPQKFAVAATGSNGGRGAADGGLMGAAARVLTATRLNYER